MLGTTKSESSNNLRSSLGCGIGTIKFGLKVVTATATILRLLIKWSSVPAGYWLITGVVCPHSNYCVDPL